MVVDLNRILLYADADGSVHDRPVRNLFNIVDGIIGGEGNGPLDAEAKAAGVILAGANSVAVDLACARLMGFDYRAMLMLHRSLENHPLPLCPGSYKDIACVSAEPEFNRALCEIEGTRLAFQPHFGWVGHVEFSPSVARRGSDKTCAV
jgi:hypothetical protein